MKQKRYPIEQIVVSLKQAELGMPVADLIRQLEITEQAYYNSGFCGLKAKKAVRLWARYCEKNRLQSIRNFRSRNTSSRG